MPKPSTFLVFAISIKEKKLINDVVVHVSLYSILAWALPINLEENYKYANDFPYILKLTTIYKCLFSALIKGRSQCYASLHCDEYGHFELSTFTKKEKMVYKD